MKRKEGQVLSYRKATAAVRQAGWQTVREYNRNYKEISGLPSAPDKVYKEWVSWDVFFGRNKPRLLSYDEAKSALQSLQLRSSKLYFDLCRERPELPRRPDVVYRERWQGWPEYLGHRSGSDALFLDYDEAKRLVRQEGVHTPSEYRALRERVKGLPVHPDESYKEWVSWPEFFGRERIRQKEFVDFEEFRRLVALLDVKSRADYLKRYKHYKGLHSSPEVFYTNWPGWSEVLRSTGKVTERTVLTDYLSYEQAKIVCINAQIHSARQYSRIRKTIPGLPAKPHVVYAAHWKGWKAFLYPTPALESGENP